MRPFMSIPLAKLLVWYSLCVVVLSCGTIFALMVFWQLPRIEHEMQAGQLRLAEAVRAQFIDVMEQAEEVARCAVVSLELRPSDDRELIRQLSQCAHYDSAVRAVYLVNDQGIVIGAGISQARGDGGPLLGENLSSQPFFKSLPPGVDEAWRDDFISPLDDTAREAIFSRHLSYTVVVELKRDEMARLAKRVSHDGLGVLILDETGQVIIDGMSTVNVAEKLKQSPFVFDQIEKTAHLVSILVDGQGLTGVVFPVPALKWQILVLQPHPEIEVSAQKLSWVMSFVLLTTLLIAGGGSAIMGMGFKRQFQRLGAFAESIKQGDYTLKWPGSRIAEFNNLASAVVEMGEVIHCREVAVAEGQTAYREILESTTELAVKISGRGKIIYANAAFCKLVGVPLEGMVNQPLTAFLRDEADPSWRVAADLHPGAGSIAFESFIVAANRHVYRVAWTVHAGRGENARKAYAAIGRDISDQWHVAEALRRSEARLRTMLDNATTVAVQWYDMHGRVIYWGPGAEKLYGYSAGEAIGRLVGQLHLDGALTAKFSDICNRIAQEGGTFGPERMTMRHTSGKALDVLMTVFSMPAENGGSYFVCMDIDITEQIKEAAARREAEQWFSTVFQASPVAMAVWNRSALYDANIAWEALFEMSVEEGRAATQGENPGLWEDPVLRAAFIDQLTAEGEVEAFSAWISGKSGARRLCQISGRQVELDDVSMWIVAYKDITAKHEAGEKLRELNETLEQRVTERTQALYRANHELSAALDHLSTTQAELIRSEKMAALGSLVAGVAHELSTPLGNSLLAANTLRDNARMLMKEMASGLRRSTLERYLGEVQDGNEIIERNLSRAAELVTSFKQVAVDQSSSQRRPFMLTEVVEEITMTLRPSLKRLPFIIKVDVEEGLELDSYPGPLGQVLTNLINNAIIHAFHERDHGVVTITGRAEGDGQICMEVSDDGVGIPEENLHRLFDPFFTTRFGQQGSGLGLPIVHSLVTNLLGGTVEVESTVGEGSRFSFWIPAVAPIAARSA